jgi:hypothetical protein
VRCVVVLLSPQVHPGGFLGKNLGNYALEKAEGFLIRSV